MLDKKILRKRILSERLAIDEKLWLEKSIDVTNKIEKWLLNQDFDKFVLYRSFRREPNINPLAKRLGEKVCFYPRVKGQSLVLLTAIDQSQLQVSRWGLEEPIDSGQPTFVPDSKTLIIVPALAIDSEGFRLGYGAGFYDRFLALSPATTLGVCFDVFLKTDLPREDHDIPLHFAVSELRLLDFRLTKN